MSGSGARHQLLASLSLALAPVALGQGLRLRNQALRLAEAPGDRHGEISGTAGGASPALRLLAIGESPLAGVGLESAHQTVACCLADRIRQATERTVQWRILARGGVTAAAVRHKLLARLSAQPADLILIGLGVNDSIALRSARRWQRELEALINDVHALAGPAPVLLAGVPDMFYFPLLPNPLRTLLGTRSRLLDHAAARLAARRADTSHVPLALDGRSTGLFCADGFHPNRAGHALWAEQLLPAALHLLDPSVN